MRFGPAGNSESFRGRKNRRIIDIPEYLAEHGLSAFEYQCGRGVKIGEEAARTFGKLAAERDIAVSMHAPYYISLSSLKEETRLGSARYLIESAAAVKWMGGDRVILHSGSCAKMSRSEALELALLTLRYCLAELTAAGFADIRLCPETMGKVNQLGTPEEVLALCGLDERLLPCYDFGHINARTQGWLKGKSEYKALLEEIENALGLERLRAMHIHFSHIEYTAGGEKRHLTFADEIFGPDFEPLAELLVQKGCDPVIICESDGTQAEDAAAMRRCVDALRQNG